jgi:hypothetical protein
VTTEFIRPQDVDEIIGMIPVALAEDIPVDVKFNFMDKVVSKSRTKLSSRTPINNRTVPNSPLRVAIMTMGMTVCTMTAMTQSNTSNAIRGIACREMRTK